MPSADQGETDLRAEVVQLRERLAVAEDRAARAGEAAEAEQARLTFELGHRVKNTLSVVQALASQTRRGSADKDEAFETLGRRIIALARANDVILKESWTTTSIGPVAEGVLATFPVAQGRLTVEGPPVRFAASRALSMAMALHELAANAERHGAWSTGAGRVDLVWHIVSAEEPTLVLSWTESGGPATLPPEKPGFGLRLAAQSLKSAFGRDVTMAFLPDGLVCTAKTPLGVLEAW